MNYRACAWLRRQLRQAHVMTGDGPRRLTAGECGLAGMLATYVDDKGYTRTPITNRELADIFGWSVKHVWRLTSALEAAGVVQIVDSGQEGNRYRIPFGVVHTHRVHAGGTHRVDAIHPPRGRDDTYIRDVGTSAPVCDSCGCPVEEPGRFRHEGCPVPPREATG